MSAFRALPALGSFITLLSQPLAAQTFPIQATVVESGKVPTRVKIGDLVVRAQGGNPKKGVFADFRFEPSRGPWLDQWYDFRWIHIERDYIVSGTPRTMSRVHGPLPAIAPQTKTQPGGPGSDDMPFFHHYTEWVKGLRGAATFREDGEFVNFAASVQGEPAPATTTDTTEVHFETYLVALGVSAPGSRANEMLVLAGFEWKYETTLSSQGQQLHDATIGGERSAVDGAARINRALANASPAFVKPSRATHGWIAEHGGALLQCPKRVGFNTQPGTGMTEGNYMLASSGGGTGNPGGLFSVDPSGSRPPVPVTGLPAPVTGIGAPGGVGANCLALTGPGANAVYVGTITYNGLGAPFDRAQLHRVQVDRQGQVVSDEVIDTVASGSGSGVVGYVDVELVPNDPCDDAVECESDDNCMCAIDDDDDEEAGSPLRHFDAATGQVTEVPIDGPLPQGILREIAIDPTGGTVFMAYAHADASGIATGTGEIVAVPVTGGAPRPVADLAFIPDTLETHARDGMLHLTGFDVSTFETVYRVANPTTGTVTAISTVSAGNVATAFEAASGEFVLAGTHVNRLDANGVETETRALFSAGVGIPNDIGVVPTPVVYGRGTPAQFGVYWDLPPRRPGGSGLADLPIEGNKSYALTLSTNGWEISGAVAIATRPSPGIDVLGVNVLVDPTSILAFVPVFGAPTVTVPLPLPDRIGPISLYGQLVFLDRENLGTSDGIKLTIIEK